MPTTYEAAQQALAMLRRLRDEKPDAWDRIVDPGVADAWDALKAALAAEDALRYPLATVDIGSMRVIEVSTETLNSSLVKTALVPLPVATRHPIAEHIELRNAVFETRIDSFTAEGVSYRVALLQDGSWCCTCRHHLVRDIACKHIDKAAMCRNAIGVVERRKPVVVGGAPR